MSRRANRFTNGLTVLYASDGSQRTDALAEVLRHRGHTVTPVSSVRAILEFEDAADVLVVDMVRGQNHHHTFELEQLGELHSTGVELVTVAVVDRSSFEICRDATGLGVSHVVQGAFLPTELVEAVERSSSPRTPDALSIQDWRGEFEIGEHAAAHATGALHESLLTAGIAPPHLARALAASAEVIENACRHAFEPGSDGLFTLETRIRNTRLLIRVSDEGVGFDAGAARLSSVPAALPFRRVRRNGAMVQSSVSEPVVDGGLARAGVLCDRFEIESTDQGSSIALEFELSPTCLVSATGVGVEECMPAALAALVREVSEGETALEDVPRALSPVIRRLLRGSTVLPKTFQQG